MANETQGTGSYTIAGKLYDLEKQIDDLNANQAKKPEAERKQLQATTFFDYDKSGNLIGQLPIPLENGFVSVETKAKILAQSKANLDAIDISPKAPFKGDGMISKDEQNFLRDFTQEEANISINQIRTQIMGLPNYSDSQKINVISGVTSLFNKIAEDGKLSKAEDTILRDAGLRPAIEVNKPNLPLPPKSAEPPQR